MEAILRLRGTPLFEPATQSASACGVDESQVSKAPLDLVTDPWQVVSGT